MNSIKETVVDVVTSEVKIVALQDRISKLNGVLLFVHQELEKLQDTISVLMLYTKGE